MEQRIGFGRRLGAYLIDCVIIGVLSMLLGPTIGGVFGAAAGGAAAGLDAAGNLTAEQAAAVGGIVGAVLGMMVALVLISTVYFLIEGFTGWTLGKLMLGIQVARADGSAAPVGTLLERYALKNISAVLGAAAVVLNAPLLRTIGSLLGLAIFVGCFFVLGAAHQAFHDMIAKTAVYPRSAVRAAA